MIQGIRAGWRGLRHFQQRGYQYIWVNALWVLLSLPIVTAPAAWAGFNRLSYKLHREPAVTLDEFWAGFRENLRRGLVIALANLLVITILVTNTLTHWGATDALSLVLQGLRTLALFVWISLQLYMWPLFYALRVPNLRGAIRNAWVMLVSNPGFTLGIWFWLVVVALLSTLMAPAWFLVTGGALVAIINSGVQDRLRAAGVELPGKYDDEGVIDASFSDI